MDKQPLGPDNALPQQIPPKKNMKKRIMITCCCFLAVFGLVVAYHLAHKPKKPGATTPASKTSNQKSGIKSPQNVRLIATGDTIAHEAINLRAKQADGTYNYYQFMRAMQPFFDKADVRFCNQAVPSGGVQFGISGYPVFNSPLEIVHDMAKLGCNVVNTGTNHTFDKGQGAIGAELGEWDKQGGMLAVAGANRSTAEQQKIRYFSKNGVKFAFLSYSTYSNSTPPNTYGLNMYNEATAKQQVAEARANSDVVLVSMRWGTEYSGSINAQQDKLAQNLADWGADIVLGHGPHVLEPVKQLKTNSGRETLVWYSIGNFLNAQEPIEALTGCIVAIDINVTTKQINSFACMPIYMHYEWTAAQKAADDLLSRKNFQLAPLGQAAGLLAKSQNNTTVSAQTDRISKLLNTYTTVPILSSSQF